MKSLVFTLFAASATLVMADPASPSPQPPPAEGQVKTSEGMPAGPLLESLTPKPAPLNIVPVPEPVWASVLAACAISLLRRVRR